MSRTIHINLLKDEERRSALPVRTRVIAAILSSSLLLAMLVWWGLLLVSNREFRSSTGDLTQKLAELQASDKAVEALLVRERAAKEEMDQIECYLRGRVVFGGALAQLAAVVPPTIQLTGLTIPPPYRTPEAKGPVAGAAKPSANAVGGARTKAPRNEAEKVFFNMNGVADSAETTDVLRRAMRLGVFTNLVVSAEIPKGAFRISGANDGVFLFEITCECTGRRFE